LQKVGSEVKKKKKRIGDKVLGEKKKEKGREGKEGKKKKKKGGVCFLLLFF